jgi:hypothetical protein
MQYLPVNWVDGMKINKSHFIAQDNALTHQLIRSIGAQLHPCNYGLLPTNWQGYKEMKLFVHIDNQEQVDVRLQSCRALTTGGFLVWIDTDTTLDGVVLQAPVPKQSLSPMDSRANESNVLIVLAANPWRRVACGNADPDESPVRLPYSMPSYELQLLPSCQSAKNDIGPYHLVIGRLKYQSGKAFWDEEYIPPCCSVSGHSQLLDAQANIHQFFGQMESWSVQIIQRIMQKKQQNDLALIVQKWCEQVCVYTATTIPGARLLDNLLPPIHLVNTVAGFARLSKNVLDFFNGSGKEEFINYCTEWCDSSQAELEESITTLANHNYDHLDIQDSLQKIRVFTKRVTTLFKNLSHLEYIGKKKDMGIFIKAQVVDPSGEQQPEKRKSLLAD